ncbi:replication protein [Streptomyces sp. Tu 6176]|uniref:phage tail tape measure protein n=1 Tax=Streptomyces sp. Tu 6176 TaxID=1470557 RepID=UPI000452BA82|nr:phage tail tape measure protein [Streptomyces sp. Tu 6176]EYT84017.1 replication protein [Streptomyces sp. Tu 6176]
MPRAGAVWVDVLPNMSGFGRQLQREIGEPVARASQAAGEQGGDGLMKGMAKKMGAAALGAGVATGALVAKGLSISMEKAASAGKLKAQLGLSPADAQKAGNAAGQLYADAVTDSVEEGAEAVRAVMAAGLAPPGATTKQLGEIATKVQDLSSMFELDLGQTANAVGQILKTGLADNGTEAMDALFAGMQKLGPRADDIADTFNEYSTIFRSLGLDVQTTMGLFSQGMQAGARDTDVIADALKEFQIRATDGSTASAAGFEALGLSAKGMTAQIAKGGKSASAGLQTVLDRLKKMKDPVDRNAAAVALFGTKAEDMAGALWALDPSRAVAALGQVGGAAKQAGDDLRDNAGTKFEAFKRRALMAIGDAAARYALPALIKVGGVLLTDVLPPVQRTAGWLGDHLGPAVKDVGAVVGGTVHWFREWGIWLSPLAVLIGGVTLALSANAVATGASTAVLWTQVTALTVAEAVTGAFATTMGVLNTVMALNPFVLVAIALVALGTALFVAWKRSETFRDIVMGVWSVVQTGAMWLWSNGLKPLVDGATTGLHIVGDAASWLWSTVLQPVFSAIDVGARILATALTVILFLPVYYAVQGMGAIFGWLWSAAIQPVFGWIAGGATWLWSSGISPVFGWITAGVHGVGAVFVWLWTNGAKPVFGWIVVGAKGAWSGVSLVFGWITSGLHLVGGQFSWLWRSAVSPAMTGIKSVVSTVYYSGIKPVFDVLRAATGQVAGAFDVAQKGIDKAWSKVSGIAKRPVEFVVNTVYNKGIRKVWNMVASKFGAPELAEFKGFARGGVLPGQSSYRDGDDQLVPMRRGEGVAVSEAMRDPYERARLLAVNKAAMRGQSLAPFQGGFAKGGIFGWVKNAVTAPVDLAKKGFDWLKDGIKDSAVAGLNSIVTPLIDKIAGDASVYRDMISGVPKRMIKDIVGYSGQADQEMERLGVGGPAFRRGLAWARTQAGKPYQWGGNGDPSWDCSGFVSAIESVIRGERPHRRWATGAFSGAQAPAGWVLNKRSPYMIGITNAGVGHTAGTLNGVNVESRGGDGVVVGARARSYKASLFTHRYGLAGYAGGGRPRAGEVAWVGESGPELYQFGGGGRVIDHESSMRIAAAKVGASVVESMTRGLDNRPAAAAPRPQTVVTAPRGQDTPQQGGDTYNFYPRTLDMKVSDLDVLQRRRDALARVGRAR